jgi:hypothetical protein
MKFRVRPDSIAVASWVRMQERLLALSGGFRGAHNDNTSSISVWNDSCLDAIANPLLFLSRRAPFSDLEDQQTV